MQVNQPQGGMTEATTTQLAIGDTASYIAISISGGRQCGRSYDFNARKGVIVKIDGSVATLRIANGRSITYPLHKLTPEGQPNALTRMLMGGQ